MTRWSTTLQRVVDVDTKRREITTPDGITYTRDELVALRGVNAEMIQTIHKAKAILGGVIVSSRRRRGAA